MKINNLKLRKKIIAVVTTGSIALTGISTVYASDNLLDEILTAADGYETTRHYDAMPVNNEIVEENMSTTYEVVEELPEEQIEEEQIQEEQKIVNETEKPSSNLLKLMDNEANQAVLDFFIKTNQELDNYISEDEIDTLIIHAQENIAKELDFLFFGGSINNHKKEEVSEETIKKALDMINKYIYAIEKISPVFLNNMDPKYDEATIYLENEYIKDFDEIGIAITNGEDGITAVEVEPVEVTVETEEIATEEPTVEEVEEVVEISAEAEQSINNYFANIEEVLVDYINNGDFEGLVINAQDTVKVAMDFLFYDGKINGFSKKQVGRQTLEDTVFRINNYIQVVEELSPGFLTNIEPIYNECTIYLTNEFIDDFTTIGKKIAEDPVDEADETYTLR